MNRSHRIFPKSTLQTTNFPKPPKGIIMKHTLKLVPPLIVVGMVFLPALVSFCQAAPLTIVADSKSSFTIIVPKVAPVSVTQAAAEMKRDILEATGVKLEIQKDDEPTTGPFISLGSTQQAQSANINTANLIDDGFQIVTKDGNLFIIGIDTTAEPSKWVDQFPGEVVLHPKTPGSAYTEKGGFSNGTANGVYSFLEDQMDVRWLFPGDLGRDVPSKSVFTIPDLNRTVTPAFNFRILSIIRGGDEWRARQKLGYSANIHYIHNFVEVVPADLWYTHPDWFPMINGKRPKPEQSPYYKLETTNPELVKYFAEKAIAALKANPEMYSYTISPSDGAGWSESPESKALYDPPPTPGAAPSTTPLVLKFYSDVSALVAKEYPRGVLGGYLYQFFSYPPQQGSMKLPENFIPTIVGKSMGYTFYRPDTRELEAQLLNDWAKVAPTNWYYYGMPTWMRESSAQVTPAAPKELNFLYHTLLGARIKGAEIYGTYMMSQGAMSNYINAKMLWNPSGDAVAIQHDWLMRAYGPKAGAVMEHLYNKLDESWWSDYFRSPQTTAYNVSEVTFQTTFGAHYPKMEKLFLEAWNQPMTEKQKQRLDLIRQNMIALQFRLRNAGYLPPEYSSPLTQTAKQVFELFTDPATKDNFSYIIVASGGGAVTPVKIELGQPASPSEKAAPIPNSNKILLYPTRDGKITLKPSDVLPGSNFLSYYLQDAEGNTFQRGFLSSDDEIQFPVKANQPYYLLTIYVGITVNPQVKWKISIPDAVVATATFQDGVLYLKPGVEGRTAPLYVVTPADLNLQTESDAHGTVVQTESDRVAISRAEREMRIAAERILAESQKQYQANLVEDLNQKWQFVTDPQKIGDTKGYFKPEFDDTAWKTISAIGPWQDHGFPGYHGAAWYRKTFDLSDAQTDPLAMGGKQLLLYFGNIDGDAEIYLNGIKIADRIAAEHSNGWDEPLVFPINSTVRTGKNTIAVKVTKESLASGLYRGAAILTGVLPN